MLFCDFDLINESCERECKMTKGGGLKFHFAMKNSTRRGGYGGTNED